MTAVSPMTTPMPWSMKNRRPMRAPGWISMPVTDRATCPSSRAANRDPGNPCAFQRRWVTRYVQMACNPE